MDYTSLTMADLFRPAYATRYQEMFDAMLGAMPECDRNLALLLSFYVHKERRAIRCGDNMFYGLKYYWDRVERSVVWTPERCCFFTLTVLIVNDKVRDCEGSSSPDNLCIPGFSSVPMRGDRCDFDEMVLGDVADLICDHLSRLSGWLAGSSVESAEARLNYLLSQ
jgi:hypothetical protein